MYISEARSLTFWERFAARVQGEIARGEALLCEKAAPIEASVDSAQKSLQRAAQSRAEVFQLLRRIEQLHLLLLGLRAQREMAIHAQGIPNLEYRIHSLRELVRVFEGYTLISVSRSRVEEDLKEAFTRNEELKLLGTGEQVSIERQALRTLRIMLPVIGQEDIREYETAVRQLHVAIDQHEADLNARKADTIYELNVLEECVGLMIELGVPVRENTQVPQQTEQVAPAAAEPAATEAIGPGAETVA